MSFYCPLVDEEEEEKEDEGGGGGGGRSFGIFGVARLEDNVYHAKDNNDTLLDRASCQVCRLPHYFAALNLVTCVVLFQVILKTFICIYLFKGRLERAHQIRRDQSLICFNVTHCSTVSVLAFFSSFSNEPSQNCQSGGHKFHTFSDYLYRVLVRVFLTRVNLCPPKAKVLLHLRRCGLKNDENSSADRDIRTYMDRYCHFDIVD